MRRSRTILSRQFTINITKCAITNVFIRHKLLPVQFIFLLSFCYKISDSFQVLFGYTRGTLRIRHTVKH